MPTATLKVSENERLKKQIQRIEDEKQNLNNLVQRLTSNRLDSAEAIERIRKNTESRLNKAQNETEQVKKQMRTLEEEKEIQLFTIKYTEEELQKEIKKNTNKDKHVQAYFKEIKYQHSATIQNVKVELEKLKEEAMKNEEKHVRTLKEEKEYAKVELKKLEEEVVKKDEQVQSLKKDEQMQSLKTENDAQALQLKELENELETLKESEKLKEEAIKNEEKHVQNLKEEKEYAKVEFKRVEEEVVKKDKQVQSLKQDNDAQALQLKKLENELKTLKETAIDKENLMGEYVNALKDALHFTKLDLDELKVETERNEEKQSVPSLPKALSFEHPEPDYDNRDKDAVAVAVDKYDDNSSIVSIESDKIPNETRLQSSCISKYDLRPISLATTRPLFDCSEIDFLPPMPAIQILMCLNISELKDFIFHAKERFYHQNEGDFENEDYVMGGSVSRFNIQPLLDLLPWHLRVDSHARNLYRNFADSSDDITGGNNCFANSSDDIITGGNNYIDISRRELDIILYFLYNELSCDECHNLLLPYRNIYWLGISFQKIAKLNYHTDVKYVTYMQHVNKSVETIVSLEKASSTNDDTTTLLQNKRQELCYSPNTNTPSKKQKSYY